MKILLRFANSNNKKSTLLLLLFGMLLSYQTQAHTLTLSATRHPNKVVVERLESYNHVWLIYWGWSEVRWYVNGVYVTTDTQHPMHQGNRVLVITNKSFYVPHLQPHSTVTITARVRHFDHNRWSYLEAPLIATQQLATYVNVSNVRATDQTHMRRVVVTWDINERFRSHSYSVIKNGVDISGWLPAGTRSFTEILPPGSPAASYSVRATINGIIQNSSPATGRTFFLNLRATQNQSNSIVLTWNNTENTYQANGIALEWSNAVGAWEEIWRTPFKDLVTKTITDNYHPIVPGVTYAYRFRVLPMPTRTTDISDIITVGKTRPNGRVSGFIRTPAPGNFPVVGVTVQAELVGPVLHQDHTRTYTTTTNQDGFFEFNSIYYYRRADFIITPTSGERVFNPVNRRVSLSLADNITEADFIDMSSYTITGNISNGSCPVAGVHITLADDTLGITDALGNYVIAVPTGGIFTVIPSLAGREFYPSQRTFVVAANVEGIDFFDNTVYYLEGRIVGSCNTVIGSGAIRIWSAADNTYPCFDQTIDTDSLGNFSIWLSPQKYYYNLIGFVSNYPAQLNAVDVKAFFSTPRLLDISKYTADRITGDTIIHDLVYRTAPKLQMPDFWPATTCGANPIPLVKRLRPLNIKFIPSESFRGSMCPAGDGMVVIRENISSDGMKVNIDTLAYKKGDTITFNLTPGTPNLIAAQGHKKFLEAILIVDGQTDTVYTEVIVLGGMPREQNFTTTSPSIPFHILHNPPGDMSYSFLETVESLTTSLSNSFLAEGTVDSYVRVQMGPTLTFEAGIVAAVAVEVETQLDVTATLGAGSSGLIDWASTITTSVSNLYRTSDNVDITGAYGDVYIGGAIAMLYGLTDVLTYDFVGCKLERDTKLFMQPKGLATTFIYTESHITDVVIPELKSLAGHFRSRNNLDSAYYFTNQRRLWEQVVLANRENIENETPVEIISFSGGTGITRTKTVTQSEAKTFEWSMFVEASVAVEAGLAVGGIGVFGGTTITGRVTTGGVAFGETVESNTVGFYLGDKDLGDDFIVEILRNRVYGTPAFRLVSGQSSCPHEPGTVPRHGTQLSVRGNRFSQSVPETEAAVFVLQLANTSQSDETMTYDLIFDHTSNPGGAVMTIGGSPIVGGIPYSYTIPAGQSVDVTITVRKGPIENTHNDLKFIFQSQCDGNIYSTVLLDADFYKQFNLNMAVNGSGTTNITGQQTYREGRIVNLFATPNRGYVFQKWVVGTAEFLTQALAVTMDRNKTATAFFVRTTVPQHEVTISEIGNGTTFPAPNNTYIVNNHERFSIQAHPELHNALAKWTVNGKAVTGTMLLDIVVTENTTVIAEFAPTHIVSIDAVGSGFVTPAIYTHQIIHGSVLSLYASPNLGYEFDKWVIGNTTLLTRQISITVNSSLTATAHFVPTSEIQHEVKIAVSNDGNTNPPAGSFYFTHGSEVSLLAIPNTGKRFDKWIINSVESTVNPVNITVEGGVDVAPLFTDDVLTSIGDMSGNEITLYPNPAKNMVTVNFGAEKVNSIEIINAIGHSVYMEQLNQTMTSKTIDVSPLQAGLYFIKLQTDYGNIVKKIIIE